MIGLPEGFRKEPLKNIPFCSVVLNVPENPQILQQEILILLQQPKNSSPREKRAYICGLRARIECEPVSEHSTRSDRVTDIGSLLSWGASPLPAATQSFFTSHVWHLGIFSPFLRLEISYLIFSLWYFPVFLYFGVVHDNGLRQDLRLPYRIP